ncbi:MAG: cytochrome c biogenesis protein ResB, partial [Candidatus Zixiibacteriota bacterium]
LTKGATRRIGDYSLTFVDFDIRGHDPSASAMKVTAQLVVEYHGRSDTIYPALTVLPEADGSTGLMDLPAQFGDRGQHRVSIARIDADGGAVLLDIPGLTDRAAKEVLVLDVSKKPAINLVWVGTSLILLGCLIAFVRRRGEMIG